MDRARLIGIALVLVSACAFGSGALFGKPVYALGIGWLTLLAWRFLVGAGLSWAWLLWRPEGRAALQSMARRAVLVSLGLGVLYVGNSSTYFAGLETVPASLAGLIVYIYPALVAVLSLRFATPLEGRRAWLGLVLALVGVVLALGGIPETEMPPLSGLLQVLASPVIYAVWIVLAARLAGERPRAGAGDSEALALDAGTPGDAPGGDAQAAAVASTSVASALMMSATAAVYWLMAGATATPLMPAEIPTEAWPGLIAIGVVSTFIAIQTFYAGTKRVGAAQASLISTVEPIWTVALAAILLGERLTPIQLLGGALILVAVVIAQTAPASAATAPAASDA
jgi:drug/metabolite transporter (DMT)-like permease